MPLDQFGAGQHRDPVKTNIVDFHTHAGLGAAAWRLRAEVTVPQRKYAEHFCTQVVAIGAAQVSLQVRMQPRQVLRARCGTDQAAQRQHDLRAEARLLKRAKVRRHFG